MKIYYNDDFIAECYRVEDAKILVRDFIRRNKIKTGDYTRVIEISNNEVKIDYGDWYNFFYIKELDKDGR